MRYVKTEIAPGSFVVRFHTSDSAQYTRIIIVTPEDNGKTLYLAGFMDKDDKPFTLSDWREARNALFPFASRVRFERLKRGKLVSKLINI